MLIKEIIGDCELYCGDAREVVKTLPKVDLFVSDVPYKLTSGGRNTGTLGGILSTKKYNNSGKIIECDITWQEICDLAYFSLKDNTHCYIMSNNRNVQTMLNAAEEAGFDFHNLLVWKKTNTVCNKYYMKNCEFTGFFKKGKAKTINDAGSQSCIEVPNIKQTSHPTEKPVALMEEYICNSSQQSEIVFDPFFGTGSTIIAALRNNRKFIGIELNENYFYETLDRVESFYGNLRKNNLFDM